MVVDELSDLKKHINKQLAKGYAPDDIRRSLLDAGFSRSLINEAFSGIVLPEVEKEPGFFQRLFKPKEKAPEPVEIPKPEKIEKPKKEKKKPEKPEAKKEGFFAKLFKPSEKIEKPVKPEKIEKPKKAEKQIEPEKPKEEKKPKEKKEGFFAALFKPKPKEEVREEKKKPKEPEKPEEKKEGFFARLFKRKEAPEKPIKEEKPKEKKKPKKEELPPPPAPTRRPIARKVWTAITIMIMLAVIMAALAFLYLAPVRCATEQCFIDKASKCEQTSFRTQIEGTTIYFEASNCVLTKTVLGLAPEEPPEIVNAFLGKSMTCRYKMNDFNPLYVRTISGLINTCDGPLRNAILEYAV